MNVSTLNPPTNATNVPATMVMPMGMSMPNIIGMPGGVAAMQQPMGYPFPQVFMPYPYEPRTPHINASGKTTSGQACLVEQQDSPGPVQVHYPLVSEWLRDLARHTTRGSDNIDYTIFCDKFAEHEIRHLDDLALFEPSELANLAGMKAGMAKCLLNWAVMDKEQLDKDARKGKSSCG